MPPQIAQLWAELREHVAYAICACATFHLYYADLEAEGWQSETCSGQYGQVLLEWCEDAPDASVSERTHYFKIPGWAWPHIEIYFNKMCSN